MVDSPGPLWKVDPENLGGLLQEAMTRLCVIALHCAMEQAVDDGAPPEVLAEIRLQSLNHEGSPAPAAVWEVVGEGAMRLIETAKLTALAAAAKAAEEQFRNQLNESDD